MVAVLQCLQRLTSSRFASADMVISPSYAARIFSALTSGDDAVATEVMHRIKLVQTQSDRMLYSHIKTIEEKPRERVTNSWTAHDLMSKLWPCLSCRQRGCSRGCGRRQRAVLAAGPGRSGARSRWRPTIRAQSTPTTTT